MKKKFLAVMLSVFMVCSGFCMPEGQDTGDARETVGHTDASQMETEMETETQTEMQTGVSPNGDEAGIGSTENSARTEKEGEETKDAGTAGPMEPEELPETDGKSYGGTEEETGEGTDAPETGHMGLSETEAETGHVSMEPMDVTETIPPMAEAAARASGQEDDGRGYCFHINNFCPSFCITAKSGQVDPTKIFDYNYNAFLKGCSIGASGYGALGMANNNWGSGVMLTNQQTETIGPFHGICGAYRFVCSEAQYKNSSSKAYAIYPGAVGVLDRDTCTVKYYDLRLTLAGFEKAFKATDGELRRKQHGTMAYFLWDPARPGIYTRQINYADIKVEVLEPGTSTVTRTAIDGFTLIKDIDWRQGVSWTDASLYYETYYDGNGAIRVASVASGGTAYYYAHSTCGADLGSDPVRQGHLGLEFKNGTTITFVQAQGRYSNDGANALAADLGAQPDIPALPPSVSLKKYVSLTANPNSGLGSEKEAYLPDYCGDTFYYRIVAECNAADYRQVKIADTLPGWLGVTGVSVYKKNGSNWSAVAAGITMPGKDPTYGNSRTMEVTIPGAYAKGSTYCIEYQVKVASPNTFRKLTSKPRRSTQYYYWPNAATLTYQYNNRGTAVDGAPVTSNTVNTYMPDSGVEPGIRKYVSTGGNPNSLQSGLSLVYGFDDVFSYWVRLSGIEERIGYTCLTLKDQLPEWLVYQGVNVYVDSGGKWVLTDQAWDTSRSFGKKGALFEAASDLPDGFRYGADYLFEIRVKVADARMFSSLSSKPEYIGASQNYRWGNTASLELESGEGREELSSNEVKVTMPSMEQGLYVLAHKYDADTGKEILREPVSGRSVFRVDQYSAAQGGYREYCDFERGTYGYLSEIPLVRSADNEGKFRVREVNPPDRYALNADWNYKIDLKDYEGSRRPENGRIEIDGNDACQDKRASGIRFRKCYTDTDEGGDFPIGGVQFGFENIEEHLRFSGVTDEDGYAYPHESELYRGARLKVYEINYKQGFPEVPTIAFGEISVSAWGDISWKPYDNSDTDAYHIKTKVTEENGYTTVTVYNEPNKFYVYKKETGSTGPQGLSGAEFSILDAKGEVVRTFATGRNGDYIVSGLPFGDYVLREDKAPEGYKMAEPVHFTYSENGQEITVYDDPKELCSVTIKKKIKASEVIWAHGNPSFLFDLKGTDSDGKAHSYTGAVSFQPGLASDPEGYLEGSCVFENIPAGEYVVSERETSPYRNSASVDGCSDWSLAASGTDAAGTAYVRCSVSINTMKEPDRSPVVTFINHRKAWDDYRHTDMKVNRIRVVP